MFHTLKLRTFYALHLLLPLPVAEWHLERLDPDTLRRFAAIFG